MGLTSCEMSSLTSMESLQTSSFSDNDSRMIPAPSSEFRRQADAETDGLGRVKVDVVHACRRLARQPGHIEVVNRTVLPIKQVEHLRLNRPGLVELVAEISGQQDGRV